MTAQAALDYKIGDVVDHIQPAPPPAVPMPARWFVQRIKPLCDLKVEREATRRGLSFFLPKIPKLRIVCGRRHVHDGPLFPGLMFVPDFEIGNPDLASIPDLGRLLHFGETPATLATASLEHIRGLAEVLRVPRSKRSRYGIGDPLTIKVGPWASWIGRFDGLDDRGRIAVLITFMKREVVVKVADDQVDPV